jgi:hypothetical protein
MAARKGPSPALAQDNSGGQSDDASKDEKKVTVEKSATGPNEQTATGEATWTKDGNTVTREATRTGPNGKTVTEQKKIAVGR